MKGNRKFCDWLIVLLVILMVVAFVSYACGLRHYAHTWENAAFFGSSFGAINALVSGLALIGVIITLRIQIKQISAMHDDMITQKFPFLELNWNNIHGKIHGPYLGERPWFVSVVPIEVNYTITNDSNDLALNVHTKVEILVDQHKPIVVTHFGAGYPLLHSSNVKVLNSNSRLESSYDKDQVAFLNALIESNENNRPLIKFTSIYDNQLGAHFLVVQTFEIRLEATDGAVDMLQKWIKRIESFKRDFADLIDRYKKYGSSLALTKEGKERFGDGDNRSFNLFCAVSSCRVESRVLSDEEYKKMLDEDRDGEIVS